MKVEFTRPKKSAEILSQLNMGKGGAIQRQWTHLVARGLTKYAPAKSNMSVIRAIESGTNETSGLIEIEGPHILYLYFGKAMEGKPKRATDRDLKYTKTVNQNAGPYFDRRLAQNEGEKLFQELEEYARRLNRESN